MQITKYIRFEKKKKASLATCNTDIKCFMAGKIVSSCRNVRIRILSVNKHYLSYVLSCPPL